MSADAPRAGRREMAGAGARSLLLTALGEFVLPRGGEVWTGTLVTALGALGVEEKSARQALSRTAAEGLLASARHGRRVRWSLTAAGDRLLREGTERIYGFMRRPHDWDGRWLVLSAGVPETQRRLRHRLRTKLTWLGLGSPAPGLWVIPDASKAAAVHDVLRELRLEDRAFAWTGPSTGVGDPGELILAAWDLADVEKRYLRFIERFEGVTPGSGRAAFTSQVLLVQEWRRFPFLDPDLPAELLQHDWPGPRAAAVFHDLRNRWHRRAQAEWDTLEDAAVPPG
ncbi:PaaX family transcriptional regulator C-terminal domain-containing protein [Nonomuraea sp. MG754425]|uniref:PaaX family transcriptional regulator n=1 Tax=Nonomuraea sp. MG754425 TaxID=2570319 RepID=UPI001F1628B7|nr:PaaX family transcriptional regulator C-terminal domain-containing protein [Nonomuraea sp. MG754425]